MVLKNSNSPFNSGTTQRLCNLGAYRKPDREDPTGTTLNITLEGLPRVRDGSYHNASAEHARALEKVYEYLGFQGPDLKEFYAPLSIHDFWSGDKNDNTAISDRSFSLSKGGLWLLSERIDSLMKEDHFMEGWNDIADVCVRRVTNVIERDRCHYKKSKVIHTRLEHEEKSYPQDHHKKTTKKTHTRGVQHLNTNRRKDFNFNGTSDEEQNTSAKRVVIEIQEDGHIDARTLHSATNNLPKEKVRKRALFKTKSFINGKCSMYKGYSRRQIKVDTEAAILEKTNSSCFDGYESDGDHEEGADMYSPHDELCHQEWSISIPRQNFKQSKSTRKRVVNFGDSAMTHRELVNTASSQYTFRHPKGSYQLIDAICIGIEDAGQDNSISEDESITDLEDGIQVVKNDPGVTNPDRSEVIGNATRCTMLHHLTINDPTLDALDMFVEINLDCAMPIELTDFTDIKSNSVAFTVRECPVSIGNCFPPVFCVKLQNLDSNSNSHDDGWCLIGASSSNVEIGNRLIWQVTLKNCKTAYEDDKLVKEQFYCLLNRLNGSHISFDGMVEMALACTSTAAAAHEEGNGNSKSPCAKRHKESSYHKSPTIDLFGVNDALKHLDNRLQNENASDQFNVGNTTILHMMRHLIETPSMSYDCSVCFNTFDNSGRKDSGMIVLLPCYHSFCHRCWQSHVFHSLAKGDHVIRCMQMSCNEIFNETTIKAFLSDRSLYKLNKQMIERRIDSSSLCQWCPNASCDKIAMIEVGDSDPLIQHFGCTVSCDCNTSWCFSCQENPHWPASCGQSDVYTKLISKIKPGSSIPTTSVTFTVDVKPCPSCRYPIEKNWGCSVMTCTMCRLDFCWKCLTPLESGDSCDCLMNEEEADSTFVEYSMSNDTLTDFPLKLFGLCVNVTTRLRELGKPQVNKWLSQLPLAISRTRHLPFILSVRIENVKVAKDAAISIANDSIYFLKDVYNFLEHFCILLSFAFLSESSGEKDLYLWSVDRASDTLLFIATQLEKMIIGQSIQQIIKVDEKCRGLLSNGREIFVTLTKTVPRLWKLSRDIPTQPYATLDPIAYYRYK